MREKICGIYMIQNKINGKIYIGQSKNIYHRWLSHINSSKNPKYPIQFAINSLGKENFSFSILEKCNKSELNQRECFYIKLYHSVDDDFGYNLLQGGITCEWTDKMKQKHSEILSKVHNTEEFKKYTSERMKIYWEENREEIIENRKDMYKNEERNKKLSDASKKLWQDDNYRKRLSESHIGNASNKNNTLVRCIETDEIKTIFEWRNLGYKNVTAVCKGKLNKTKEHSFEFIDESLRPTKEKIIEYKNKHNKKANSKNKRLCLDPITKLPISYISLSRKKQTKEEYKNIILKNCIITDEKELEYYTNLRKNIRTMPYTYTNSKEQRKALKERNKEKERLRDERLCLDPITNETIKYRILKYRKRTNSLYKNIILKDCVI